MNMISTGTFLTEMDASNKQNDLVSKLVSAWEKKNAKVARAGGVSLMALSLAACGSDDDTAATETAVADTTTVTPVVPVVPVNTTSTLTAGIDSVTGGAGDDIINAGLTAAGQQTLTALDSLKGGDGTDTMAVVLKSNATPASDSVEVYTVTATVASALSMLGSTGVTSITNTGSSATLTVSNVALGTALTLGNTAQGGTFNYAAADVAGTADSATIDISSVTGGAMTVGAGVETLTLNSVGTANTLGSLSSGATTLNITGDQNMTITGNATATTIDASAATGKITVTSDNTKAVSITTGSGVDAVTMTGSNALTDTVSLGAGNDKVTFTANLADADIVDGGEGTDTVVGLSANIVALTSDATTSNLTNFEAIQVSNSLGGALDVSSVQEDGITTVTLASATTNILSADRTVTGEAGALTVNLGKSAAGNTIGLGNALTVHDGADNAGTTDTATINNTAINSTTGANVALNDDIVSTGYENIVFNAGAGSGNTVQAMPSITVNADAAASATSLTIKGSNSVNISTGAVSNTTGVFTIDASLLNAQAAGTTTLDVNAVTTGTAGTITLTGSGGDDLIGVSAASPLSASASTVNAGGGKDTIFTGAGNDTVNGGAGKDAINTGAGNDTVDAGADDDTIDFSGNFTIKDSVDGGDGTDTLKVNNADATTVNAYSLGQINTLNGRISNIEKIDFGAASLTQAIDMARLDSISTVEFAALGGASTISGLAATNEIIFREDTGATLSLALADDTGTADVLNLTIKESDLLVANTLTASNIETINIKGIDDAAADLATINTMTLTANKATKVVVTGNDGLNLTATGSTKITDFDASGVAATNSGDTAANMKVTYASLNTSTIANVSIKGGAGNDLLTGNASIDTITGNGGADTMVMSAGNDVYSGGAGNDQVNITEALMINNSETKATFDGGAGTDIIKGGEDAIINVVDADFRGFTSFETFTTANGTNNIVFGAAADAAGIVTIIGGTAGDTIDIRSVDFDNAVKITGGATADTIKLGTQAATLIFSATNGLDLLTGFTASTDKLDFSALSFQANSVSGAKSGALTSFDTMAEIQATTKHAVVLVNDTNVATAGLATALNASNFDTDVDAAALFIMEDSANSHVEVLYAVNTDTTNNNDVAVTQIGTFTDLAAVGTAILSGDIIIA
jgi:S-layer protein